MMIRTLDLTDFSEKMKHCQDYIHSLEEEREKIQVFQRELPLCLELVTQAIETCKQQLSDTTTMDLNLNEQSQCSEQTSSDGPVLEEFIPLKKVSFHSDNEEKESKTTKINVGNDVSKNGSDKSLKKSDWLRSVQLWNQTPDPSPKEVEVTAGGAFQSFKIEKSATPNGPAPASTSSTTGTGGSSGGGGNKKEERESESHRKARRCWSPELHRRFVKALQQLGGSHVGTPKQIRELMKVDGLTNDEVKSHLQKYRLHTIRRPGPSIHHNCDNQPPQFLVVGGIWVPPEYATMATNSKSEDAHGGGAATRIYTPIATLPPHFQEN